MGNVPTHPPRNTHGALFQRKPDSSNSCGKHKRSHTEGTPGQTDIAHDIQRIAGTARQQPTMRGVKPSQPDEFFHQHQHSDAASGTQSAPQKAMAAPSSSSILRHIEDCVLPCCLRPGPPSTGTSMLCSCRSWCGIRLQCSWKQIVQTPRIRFLSRSCFRS